MPHHDVLFASQTGLCDLCARIFRITMGQTADMSPLISTQKLAEMLGSSGVHVLDATALLPGETFNPQQSFAAAHIPGSRYFDIELFSDPESALPHTAPSAARFSHLFGRLGITAQDTVVFYDQGNVASACRGWWLTRLFGHEHSFILDGGLPAWVRDGHPTEAAAPTAALPAPYQPRTCYTHIVGLGDMMDIVKHDSRPILDARSAARFYGETPEPRPNVASGHMPGARNMPYKNLLNTKGQFLPPEQLHTLFAQAGITEADTPVTTCGSGMTAAVLTAGLAIAGLNMGALYDGSWAEWGSFPNAPVTVERTA